MKIYNFVTLLFLFQISSSYKGCKNKPIVSPVLPTCHLSLPGQYSGRCSELPVYNKVRKFEAYISKINSSCKKYGNERYLTSVHSMICIFAIQKTRKKMTEIIQ